MSTNRSQDSADVYTQTNDPGGNQVIACRRAADGTLTPLGAYDTGGPGTGKPHLASQGSVVLSGDGRWLFAVNAGSDDLSVFAVGADGLALVDRVDAGGVTTDLAPTYPMVLEELLPSAWHRTDRSANNRIEADHGRLKARLRPMRGRKQDRSARVIIAGHAFVQNLRRGYYELAVEQQVNRRLAVAFDELALAI
jgi:DDE domain/Lactonase, 7-bladed beta-propeller